MQIFSKATKEIEMVMAQFRCPQGELFDRYLNKNMEEKEAFVLALIGQALVNKARKI